MNERLYRTNDDRMLLGVLGGIAVRLDVDPSLVRVVFVIVWLATGLIPLFVLYIVAALIIPEAPAGYEAWVHAARAGWRPGAFDAPGSGGGPAAPPTGAWPAPPPAAWPADTASAAADAATTDTAAAADGAASTAGVAAAGADAGGPTSAAGPDPVGPPPDWGSAWDATGRPMARPRRDNDGRIAAAIGGIVLVSLGVIFLAGQLVPQVDWGLVWPIALIALGALLVIGSIRRVQ